MTERTAEPALRVLIAFEQRCRGTRTADQALRVRQHDRIVPWALHDERQVEFVGGLADASVATPLRSRSRVGTDT